MNGLEFRMANGIAHICAPNLATALCGTNTRLLASERAVPCTRCLSIATDRLAEAD